MKLIYVSCLSLFVTAVSAQDLAPDAQVKQITDEFIGIIQQDKDIRAGNQKKSMRWSMPRRYRISTSAA